MSTEDPLVLVSWDGQALPLAMIELDALAAFKWVLFDFSGTRKNGPCELRGQALTVLSAKTECKGEIYQALANHLHASASSPEYVALLDDDIITSISDINRTLHLARCAGLDVCSPTLSHDSEYTHRWTLRQANRLLRSVDWVEVMMPFYRGDLFLAGRPYYTGNISSWGIDKYLMPTLQQLLDRKSTALIDGVMASHRRAVTSGNKIYKNGRTAAEEAQLLKQCCQDLIASQAAHLLDTDWYRRIFVRRHARTRWQQLKFGLGRKLRRWLEEST